jgi:hypothetical protein
MAESKTPEANYRGRTDIIVQEDTVYPLPEAVVNAATLAAYATARAQHLTKMDAEVTAREARAATAYGGNQTTGSTKRGKL